METRVDDSTVHITGYVKDDAFDPLKAAIEQVEGDSLTLAFDEGSFINSTGLAVLMDLLLPLEDSKSITSMHPKAHFRRVFEITGMARDFEVPGG